MFVDDRHNEGQGDRGERGVPQTGRGEPRQQPLADREVPLGRHAGLSPAIHAWLDGELPEAAVRKGETAKDVEFWQMIGQETAQIRRLRTPPHVEAMIMGALPQTAPQLITPWYRREFVVTPRTALASALVIVAATAALTALLLGIGR